MNAYADWPAVRWLKDNYAWLLIVSCLLLFTTKNKFNLPLLVMAILGSIQIIRHWPEVRANQAMRLMLLLFLCLWIPIVLSVPGAVEMQRAASTAMRYIGFILAGVFIVHSLQNAMVRQRVFQAGVIIILFWCVDGLIQQFFGSNILGNPVHENGRLTGLFYPKARIGTVTAVVSPLIFELVRRNWRTAPWSILALPVLLAVLLLGGSRSSWIMFIVAIILYAGMLFVISRRSPGWKPVIATVVVILIAIVAVAKVPVVQKRVSETAGVFSSNLDAFDKASSMRLSLWEVALTIYRDNPVNGIGPRGFRYAYASYADTDNFWMTREEKGATHPHLMVLEVAAETGTIGLVGYLLFYVLLSRGFVSYSRSQRLQALPWIVTAAVAVFPLNAHMALYGSYWGTIAWWLLFIALGMSQTDGQQEELA